MADEKDQAVATDETTDDDAANKPDDSDNEGAQDQASDATGGDAESAKPSGATPPPPPDDAPPSDGDGEDEPLVTPGMNWFVLRVASNKEDSVRETLLKKVKIEGFEHLVNRILVPTEKQKTIKAGKQKILLKKLYPGYVFVEMRLEKDGRIPQDVFFLIKETTGVGDFIGTAGHPTPMPLNEVEKIIEHSKPPEETEAVAKSKFEKGDRIKIKDGPFINMEGEVDEALPDQGKVRVIVTIFGRSTQVEVEDWVLERVDE